MKTLRSFFIAAALAATFVSAVPLQASVLRNGGETTLTLDIAFGFRDVAPSRTTVPPTERLTIKAPSPLANFTNYGWYKNGNPIPGATDPVLIIDVAQPSDAGIYKYDLLSRDSTSERGSQLLMLNVRPATSLINISTRGFAGPGDQTLISGFIVAGGSTSSGSSTLLIRAVGPTLARFGVGGVLKEPMLQIFTADGQPYSGAFQYPLETGYLTKEQHIAAITAKVGAFPLDPGAKDAVDLRPFPPGAYTVHVTGNAGSSGNVLLEILEVSE